MSEIEQAQRDAVVAEAMSWLRTAYHHEGRIKIKLNPDGSIKDRGGVDCANLPYLVYRAAGMIGALDIPHYPPDWFLHRSEEKYLGLVLSVAREITGPPKPGDFALWKIGRCYAHGAIVVEWPRIIHADVGARAVILDRADGGRLQDKAPKLFTMWSEG